MDQTRLKESPEYTARREELRAFKHDLRSEDDDGHQDSTISVFTLDPDGSPRHFYSAHPTMAGDIDQRGIDLLAPVWHILDLTPQGRDDWYAQLDYGRSPTRS